MANIIIEDVPEIFIKKYGTRVKFDYNLFFQNDFDIDFRELDNSEVTNEILNSIKETKKIPKHLLCNV